MEATTGYGIRKVLACSYEEAIPKVKAALAEQGFGILTEINVKETLKKKLDVEFPKYIILGACNPMIAHETLKAEREIGLLLPCNVIVYEDTEGKTVASAIDPVRMIGIIDNADLQPQAAKVRELLQQAINSL